MTDAVCPAPRAAEADGRCGLAGPSRTVGGDAWKKDPASPAFRNLRRASSGQGRRWRMTGLPEERGGGYRTGTGAGRTHLGTGRGVNGITSYFRLMKTSYSKVMF